jgi:hypothetical protein
MLTWANQGTSQRGKPKLWSGFGFVDLGQSGEISTGGSEVMGILRMC